MFPILVLCLQVSCNNEVDVNAEWRETIVIYGVLEPGEDQQKIRVSKAFQNKGTSALKAAKISDSSFLDTVIVTLTDLSTGEKFILSPSFDEPKEPGVFADDKNPIYILDKDIHQHVIKEFTHYKIETRNPITGYNASAVTKTVGKAGLISPVTKDKDVFYFGRSPSFVIKPGLGTYVYSAKFDLHIKEWNVYTPDTLNKTMRWNFVTNLLVSPGDFAVKERMPRITFFQYLALALEKDKDLRRILVSGDFKITGANKDFYDFISVNQPSIGVVQKQTQYSNVTNGYGLFGSRSTQWIRNCEVHSGLVAALRNDTETAGLNFQY